MIYYFTLLILMLAIVLFTYNAKNNKAILYFIGYLLCMAIYAVYHHLVFLNNSVFKLALIHIHFLPIYYLIGPFIYFYVRSTLRENYFLNKKDLLHFLPALIGLVSILPYISKDFTYKTAIAQQILDNPNTIKSIRLALLYPNYVTTLTTPLLFFVYNAACLIMIWNYTHKKYNNLPLLQKELIIKWLISITSVSFLICISYLTMIYIFFFTENIEKEVFNSLPISTFTGFAYTIIPVVIIIFPEILYGIPKTSITLKLSKINAKEKAKHVFFKTFNKDPFSQSVVQILTYIEKEKPYLNPKFSINDIVTKLDISKHHVHYCFNTIIQTKFTTLKNNYRIAHAKSLLLSDKMSTMTVEGIGLESGFASKSHFFSMFKQFTELTPYEFIEQHKY